MTNHTTCLSCHRVTENDTPWDISVAQCDACMEVPNAVTEELLLATSDLLYAYTQADAQEAPYVAEALDFINRELYDATLYELAENGLSVDVALMSTARLLLIAH